MIKALTDLAEDSQVRVVVPMGEGQPFCAGRDTEMRAKASLSMHQILADYLELKKLTDSLSARPRRHRRTASFGFHETKWVSCRESRQ